MPSNRTAPAHPLVHALAVAAIVLLTPHVAAASDPPMKTIYDFYLGGIKAGEVSIDADFHEDHYEARSVLRTAGIVGLVYKASFEAETFGALTENGLSPRRFAADSRMRSKKQRVEMIYTNDAPATVNAEPAFVEKSYQIDPAAQTGTLDPISAAISALAPMPRERICNRSVQVFDGRRRYAIDLGEPVVDGKRTRCSALYRRIAGFKPKMMKKRPEFPFRIWFEDRPDGRAHIVRAAGESMFGLAVVLLRDEP
ncbi:MAG: DUF3108 domain-containing protein [Pseudomonadota bacterium]